MRFTFPGREVTGGAWPKKFGNRCLRGFSDPVPYTCFPLHRGTLAILDSGMLND